MFKKIKSNGTTFTAGLFLVSTVSGLFLFFHVASPLFHSMHEWLSVLLVLPVAIHLWKNWPAFVNYFRRRTIILPLVVSLIAGTAFAYPALTGGQTGGNPMRAAVGAIQNGTIAQVAPLYELSPQALQERLQAKGYVIKNVDQKLIEVARASGKEAGPALLAAVAFPHQAARQ